MGVRKQKRRDNRNLPLDKVLQYTATPTTPFDDGRISWTRPVHLEGTSYSMPCFTEPYRLEFIQVRKGQKRKDIKPEPHNATKGNTSVRGSGRKRKVKS